MGLVCRLNIQAMAGDGLGEITHGASGDETAQQDARQHRPR